MTKHSWKQITPVHILAAFQLYEKHPEQYSRSKSTFVVYGGKSYPAKAIRGIAYTVCHGVAIRSDEYAGGVETVRFFTRLGFQVQHASHAAMGPAKVSNNNSKQSRHHTCVSLDKRKQKHALQRLLQHYGVLVTEMTFPWLRVPSLHGMDAAFQRVYNALCAYRGHTIFIAPNLSLAVDMYVESLSLIVEYDEDQHFSQARKVALEQYAENQDYGFSVADWIATCEAVKASDAHPVTRDETRAFYDTVRDVMIPRQGLKLLRLRHGDFDWEAPDAAERLAALIGTTASADAGRITPCVAGHAKPVTVP
jgi:very-short-patch-repair endonuclease